MVAYEEEINTYTEKKQGWRDNSVLKTMAAPEENWGQFPAPTAVHKYL